MKTEIIVTIVVSVLLLVVLACSLLGGAHWALNRFRPNGPDVGMALMVEDETEDHECHGCESTCDECGALMARPIEFDRRGIELTEYGSHMVHRHCLMARRDGLTACADCARVMVGAA